MNVDFYGLNYYSNNPDELFEWYKKIGFKVIQEKESDDYYGAAFALQESQTEPVMWIWKSAEGEPAKCCNNLYFRTNGKIKEIYENVKASGISCEPPYRAPWGGTEFFLIDPDGNTILFV